LDFSGHRESPDLSKKPRPLFRKARISAISFRVGNSRRMAFCSTIRSTIRRTIRWTSSCAAQADRAGAQLAKRQCFRAVPFCSLTRASRRLYITARLT
jgi:hypothetical protein